MGWREISLTLLWTTGSAAAMADELVLTFTGDLMAHGQNQAMPDYDDIYRSLEPWLNHDDWSFINLETPVDASQPPSGYPLFNARPAYVRAAIRGGFDVFSVANNHSNDFGVSSVEGTLQTMKALDATETVFWSGLKEKEDEVVHPVLLKKKGWTIGFVALTNVLNLRPGRERVNVVSLWDVWSKVTYIRAKNALLDRIRTWRQNVDLLVVSLHDGVEMAGSPDPAQETIYQEMVEAGVDILWGTHPHVVQHWKWIQTPRGPRVVLYSLGNFVSNQTFGLGPADWASPWAQTGDGVLFRIQAARTAGGVSLHTLPPVLLNNYRDPQKGILVVPTRTLVDQSPSDWKNYYRHRLEAQESWAASGD